MRIDRKVIVLCAIILCGCASNEVNDNPTPTEIIVPNDMQECDTAFGKPCIYVDGNAPSELLSDSTGISHPEWNSPEDGWCMQEIDGKKYLQQVYLEDILVLPFDYGSNTHVIVGLDGELPEECTECTE